MIDESIYCMARIVRPELESYGIGPKDGGILPSEMLLLLSVMEIKGVKHIVESGRRNGYSTSILAHWARRRGIVVDSVEFSPVREVDEALKAEFGRTLRLHKGDGAALVPQMATGESAALMDGPKGIGALNVGEKLKVPVWAIHDVHRRCEGGKTNPVRTAAEKRFPMAIYSDDPDWIAEFGEMDREHWITKGYGNRSEMTAVGFTLMVVTQ